MLTSFKQILHHIKCLHILDSEGGGGGGGGEYGIQEGEEDVRNLPPESLRQTGEPQTRGSLSEVLPQTETEERHPRQHVRSPHQNRPSSHRGSSEGRVKIHHLHSPHHSDKPWLRYQPSAECPSLL